MNTQEQQAARKIAGLMRTARKGVGLTQIDVSKHLGISQSALSKIENGLLVPSAPQWFEFCSFTGIAADSLVSGYIERPVAAVLESRQVESPFKLNKRYLEARGSKARAMLPFVGYFSEIYGEAKLEEYLNDTGVDPDFFFNMENQINLNFCLDISKYMIKDGKLKSGDFPKLVKTINQGMPHGRMHFLYDNADSVASRMKILVSNSKHYECNFNYSIEDVSRNLLQISVKPEKHLKDFSYKTDDVLGDFLCKYKQHYFQRFTAYGKQTGGLGDGALVEKECHYHGADRCVYELKIAA